MFAQVLAIWLAGVASPPTASAAREAIREADRRFSQASERRDAEAWAAFLTDDPLFFGNGVRRGRADVRASWAPFFRPEGPSLTWEPTEAEVSSTADLGYTIGRWTLQAKDAKGAPTTLHGEYLTVWQRQPDGGWRVTLDGGREPLKVSERRQVQRLAEGSAGDLSYVAETFVFRPSGKDADQMGRTILVRRRAADGTLKTIAEGTSAGALPASPSPAPSAK